MPNNFFYPLPENLIGVPDILKKQGQPLIMIGQLNVNLYFLLFHFYQNVHFLTPNVVWELNPLTNTGEFCC